MKNKRPSSVRALYYRYDINFDKKSVTSDHGSTDTESKVINITDRDNEEMTKEVLFHELLHVAFDDSFAFEGDNADDEEEKIVRILSPRLMQMFRDNPELSSYLFFNKEKK